MKSGVRVAAVTSGPASRGKKALLVCVIMQNRALEGVLSSHVTSDGSDASSKITAMLRRSRFMEQVKLIAVNGITIAGLNVIDTKKVGRALGASFIILTRHRPRRRLLVKALRRLGRETRTSTKGRIKVVEGAAGLGFVKVGGFFAQSDTEISEDIARTAFEALRLSHIISRGIATGESKGRV